MFNITIENENYKQNSILCKIIIWDFEEYFLLDISSKKLLSDYKTQWLEGIGRLEKGYNESILITSPWNWRVIHKDGERVYITERIFKENLFDNPYKNIWNRRKNRLLTKVEIEEGLQDGIMYGDNPMLFSEWEIDFSNLVEFRKLLSK